MHFHLIVVETRGAGSAYHHAPYRIAGSMGEAMELMQEYMRIGPDDDSGKYPPPDFFLIYPEWQGTFQVEPIAFDEMLQPADAAYQEFLAETGRI